MSSSREVEPPPLPGQLARVRRLKHPATTEPLPVLDFDGAEVGRIECLTTAHLGDTERQFITTLVLGKLVTWMRRQSGTTDLRALLYMDEVAGYLPPTANPPTKQPMMTLFKQARAFGLGVVVSTQNPVDVDYKALSNAGTWMMSATSATALTCERSCTSVRMGTPTSRFTCASTLRPSTRPGPRNEVMLVRLALS